MHDRKCKIGMQDRNARLIVHSGTSREIINPVGTSQGDNGAHPQSNLASIRTNLETHLGYSSLAVESRQRTMYTNHLENLVNLVAERGDTCQHVADVLQCLSKTVTASLIDIFVVGNENGALIGWREALRCSTSNFIEKFLNVQSRIIEGLVS